MLFGKIAMEALSGGNGGRWETYFFIFVFICFNVGMEYWRQKALNLFSTMYVVPLMQVSLVVFSVITGGIFFTEFNNLEAYKLALFCVGVAVICVGVAILSADTESRAQIPAILKLKAAIIAVYAVVVLKNSISKKDKDDWGLELVGVSPDKNELPFTPTPMVNSIEELTKDPAPPRKAGCGGEINNPLHSDCGPQVHMDSWDSEPSNDTRGINMEIDPPSYADNQQCASADCLQPSSPMTSRMC